MKNVQLTERDRLIIRIAAINTRAKSIEDLRSWGKTATVLKLDDLPGDKAIAAADAASPCCYGLEDAQYEALKKVFDGMAEWPYAVAQDVVNTSDHIGAAKDAPVDQPPAKA